MSTKANSKTIFQQVVQEIVESLNINVDTKTAATKSEFENQPAKTNA